MTSSAAHRTVWQRRYAGTLAGGPDLLVALVMAELAEPSTGALTVGGRELAEVTGLARSTVQKAIATAGLFKVAERGRGKRPSRYVLAAGAKATSPVDNCTEPRISGRLVDRYSGRQGSSSGRLAADFGPVAAGGQAAQLEPKTLEPRFSGRHDERTAPVEIADHVAMLRDAMAAHPSNGSAP